jgi:hypothetical protein
MIWFIDERLDHRPEKGPVIEQMWPGALVAQVATSVSE